MFYYTNFLALKPEKTINRLEVFKLKQKIVSDEKVNRFIDTYLRGYLDISGGHVILRNNNIYVNDGDISLNGRLLVNQDASLNSKLFFFKNN